MTSARIKEIHLSTAYPESVSVQQALLQVWNECEQSKSNPSKLVEALENIVNLNTPAISVTASAWASTGIELAMQYVKIIEIAQQALSQQSNQNESTRAKTKEIRCENEMPTTCGYYETNIGTIFLELVPENVGLKCGLKWQFGATPEWWIKKDNKK